MRLLDPLAQKARSRLPSPADQPHPSRLIGPPAERALRGVILDAGRLVFVLFFHGEGIYFCFRRFGHCVLLSAANGNRLPADFSLRTVLFGGMSQSSMVRLFLKCLFSNVAGLVYESPSLFCSGALRSEDGRWQVLFPTIWCLGTPFWPDRVPGGGTGARASFWIGNRAFETFVLDSLRLAFQMEERIQYRFFFRRRRKRQEEEREPFISGSPPSRPPSLSQRPFFHASLSSTCHQRPSLVLFLPLPFPYTLFVHLSPLSLRFTSVIALCSPYSTSRSLCTHSPPCFAPSALFP